MAQQAPKPKGDLQRYFEKKCEELEQEVQEKRVNLQRL